MKLDLLDKKIINELSINSRTPSKRIAKKVGSSKETVNYRIKKLEENGFIRRFNTVFDMSKLGYKYYLIYLKLDYLFPVKEKEIINYLRNSKLCLNVRLTEGSNYDLDFVILVKNSKELDQFFDEFKEKFGESIHEKQIDLIIETYQMNKRFFKKQEKTRESFVQSTKNEIKLDKLDKKIINFLSINSKIKFTEIAKKLNANPKTVAYKIKKLEKKGVIFAYTILQNYNKMGLNSYEISLMITDPKEINSMLGFFDNTNKASSARKIIGQYDLTIELNLRSNEYLRKVMEKFKKKFKAKFHLYEISQIYREYSENKGPFQIKNE